MKPEKFISDNELQRQHETRLTIYKLVGLAAISVIVCLCVDPLAITIDVVLGILIFIAGGTINNSFTLSSIRVKQGLQDNRLKSIVGQENLNWDIANDNWCKKRGAKKYLKITLDD